MKPQPFYSKLFTINSTVSLSHSLLVRDLDKSEISLLDRVYTLVTSSQKRLLIFETNTLVDTKPQNIIDNAVITNEPMEKKIYR